LVYPDGQTIDYLATSGVANWQIPDDQWMRGKGLIPGGNYQILSEAYWLETRGIEGLFFHITPDLVGSARTSGELGIHFDANFPGTAGCIGLPNREGWSKFCSRLLKIVAHGIETLPLTVQY